MADHWLIGGPLDGNVFQGILNLLNIKVWRPRNGNGEYRFDGENWRWVADTPVYSDDELREEGLLRRSSDPYSAIFGDSA